MYKDSFSKFINEIRRSKNNIITDSSPNSETKSVMQSNNNIIFNGSSNSEFHPTITRRKKTKKLSTKKKIELLLQDDNTALKQLTLSPNSRFKIDRPAFGRYNSKGTEQKVKFNNK